MNESTVQLKQAKTLPDGWRRVRLGDIADIVNGFGFPNYLQGKTKLKFPFIKVGDMNLLGNDIYINNATNTVDEAALRELGAQAYPPGTIIFPKVGGAIATNKKRILAVEATFDNNVMGVVPQNTVISEWIFLFLLGVDLSSMSRVTAVPSIRQSDIASLNVPLPPLAEQKRIAAKIQELLAEVEHARTACEARLDAANALPKAYLRQIFESEEAKNWEKRRLGELFNVRQGAAMSPYRREGISPRPFLRTLNVLWGRVDLSTVDKMDFTDEEVTGLSLEPGDLLVCEGGEVGRTAIWRGEIGTCLYQNHIHRLRKINDIVVPEFYMYWMQVAFQVFRLYSGEESITTIPNLSGNRLKSFIVPLPPTGEQKRIAAELQENIASAEKLKLAIEKELETIKALPQAILRKAFRGEL